MREVEVRDRGPKSARSSISSRPRRNGNCLGWVKLISITILAGVCAALVAAEPQGVVLVGAGSSVPLPLYRKWADLYNQNSKTVQLQYLPLGTIEGIAQITHGTSDFGAGEVPLTIEERRLGNLTELPVVLIGIVPIYNLPGIQSLRLSGDVLAQVYLGHISNWNDPAIARLNPGTALPNMPIRVFYRPGGKGSNYVFTEFLSKVNAKFREQIGRSPSPKWPVGQPAERSSDMADKIKSTPGALGYVELQYADDNQITHASVLNAAGKFVKATAASITASCTAIEAPEWDKLASSLTNAPGANSYPISSFTWLLIPEKFKDVAKRDAMKNFVKWAITDGQGDVEALSYAKLPKEVVDKELKALDKVQ